MSLRGLVLCFVVAMTFGVVAGAEESSEDGVLLRQRLNKITGRDRVKISPVQDLRGAVVALQPWYTAARSKADAGRREEYLAELVDAVEGASAEFGIDQYMAIVVARRESSLFPRIGHGIVLGAKGDTGYFQILPRSEAMAVCRVCDDLKAPECNARVALCYMVHLKKRCGDDPWVWMSAYRTGGCPGGSEARKMPEIRMTRRFLCDILGPARCQERWPE